jgi:hypothetical protein
MSLHSQPDDVRGERAGQQAEGVAGRRRAGTNTVPTQEEAFKFMFNALVYQHMDMAGLWEGWKFRGKHFISPDGDRITPQRLRGLLWRDVMELRRAGYASRKKAEAESRKNQLVKVVVVPLRQLLDGQQVAAA